MSENKVKKMSENKLHCFVFEWLFLLNCLLFLRIFFRFLFSLNLKQVLL
jgi:hypothetical protein